MTRLSEFKSCATKSHGIKTRIKTVAKLLLCEAYYSNLPPPTPTSSNSYNFSSFQNQRILSMYIAKVSTSNYLLTSKHQTNIVVYMLGVGPVGPSNSMVLCPDATIMGHLIKTLFN